MRIKKINMNFEMVIIRIIKFLFLLNIFLIVYVDLKLVIGDIKIICDIIIII